ncbi:MAG: hypothetical protein HQK82_10180, partial [Desulfovibrionaceae bacterium]|nr:hypothetical protein [Desulfovibrionaceae bacterium]
WLENANGVVLKLQTKNKGVMLSLGGDGLVIEFAKDQADPKASPEKAVGEKAKDR